MLGQANTNRCILQLAHTIFCAEHNSRPIMAESQQRWLRFRQNFKKYFHYSCCFIWSCLTSSWYNTQYTTVLHEFAQIAVKLLISGTVRAKLHCNILWAELLFSSPHFSLLCQFKLVVLWKPINFMLERCAVLPTIRYHHLAAFVAVVIFIFYKYECCVGCSILFFFFHFL